MICFYRSGVLDGKCAGAIVKRKFPDCRLYGIDYGDDFPWEAVEDVVYMVDFSLPPEEIMQLCEQTNLHLYEHHASTIVRIKEEMGSKTIAGIQDSTYASCEAVWSDLFPDEEQPLIVKFLGVYDTWRFKGTPEEDVVMAFQYGARLLGLEPENQKMWSELFSVSCSDLLFRVIVKDGAAVLLYMKESSTLLCKAAFPLIFQGRRCFALNTLKASSKVFDSLSGEDCDLFIAFGYTGKAWRVSLFSEKIDVSKIAITQGGGGHTGAAGFICSKLPFDIGNGL